MSYYTRLLTSNTSCPTLEQLFQQLTRNHIHFWSNIPNHNKELKNQDWKRVELYYDKKKIPIIIERNILSNNKKNLVQEEIKEFLTEIEALPFSVTKIIVKFRLKQVKQIFAFRIPTGDINKKGWKLRDEVLNYLVDNVSGFHQADREGFYFGKNLVLETP